MVFAQFRRLPTGLLAAIALVVVVERTVDRHTLDFNLPWAIDWEVAGRTARREATRAEVLCFGDSLVKFGVIPPVLSGSTSRVVQNVAVHMGQAPSSYFLLRRALEAGARPAAILVDFTPHLLAHGPEYTVRQWPELLEPREALELAWVARDADLFASISLGRRLPSLKARHELRECLDAALGGRWASKFPQMVRFLRNWRRNGGAQLMGRSPVPGGTLKLDPDLADPRWACHPVNAAFLRRFLDLAEARSIPVYWLLPPVSAELRAARVAGGAEDRYLAFLREVQATRPQLRVIDASRAGFSGFIHSDPLHLDRRGAISFSAAVAEVLAAPPTPWAEVSRLVDPAPDLALEDVDQSWALVAGGTLPLRR